MPSARFPAEPFAFLEKKAVIAVAMSGGVDSSVAAARCVEQGFSVIGITLAMWPRGHDIEKDRGCCSVDAVDDARRVAATLGIPYYAWNLEETFHDEVIANFEDEYAAGRTPNPCVRCNDRIKFGALLHRAREVGATHIATGHYARIGQAGDAWTLHRGADARKDQAYTLYQLTQEKLAAAVFPIGDCGSKDDVRAEAERLGLLVSRKPDSQELCFVSSTVTVELQTRLAGRFAAGPIVHVTNGEIGEHRGLPFYTVGQRSRLNISATTAQAEPLYVIALDAVANAVIVGPKEALEHREIRATRCSWVSGTPPQVGSQCTVQVRVHGHPHPAIVVRADEGSMSVRLDDPVLHVSNGQSAVLYRGDEVIGGGIIDSEGNRR